ncbi:eukaryotic translation initiation factor 3 subunit A isoform X6 [Mauremys reevesii]|uniref:eukaryotic translation initiation factor 3 subunit A isoform X2 n=1 Tax=Mauremys reevesii TaxID=260615 RepID=UPI0019401BF7|nr:eukaryotic translation initiation factor 3 subunit A isoform X2 [Mauremys reevesii]XP_039403659.1 eukaryotic translation initiation factor 3 subunit A isoform X6 [Mauremys reevesii]
MPVYFQRPENALKRANEFLEVGKKQPALDVLYDVMKSKKHRTWQKIHEPIMLKYLELCVDLRKSHLAKEGLYQYKNICQQVNIKSLEDVVRAYLKLAEEKTEAAKEESQQMVLDIEDLDNIQTPESVLLSAVSGEDTQDRTDRLLLTPWVKFLWESYRQCLDLLRNNSRVERLYHDIAQQAFKFCLQYTRKAEFRKLCDNLRMHLGQIQRHHNQSTAINLSNPESQSMHLETRLVQLDSAISMELWQEAFKAVEDIHGLFSLSKKPPKPQLMANYYHKVSTVFWKSGNALFHASTLHRLYHLSREMRKNLTQEEMQRMSTRVLLATLSIPITPERTDIARLLDMDGIIVEKQRRLATLLGLQAPPTRISLINDMVRFNVVQHVVPEVKDLYNWLEVDFHPLKLCDRVTKVLNWVRDQVEKEPELQLYVPHLQNNTILRLLQQVAQIYQTIDFSRLTTLVPFVDAFQLERAIVDAARHCDLQVRLDHTSRTLSFGSDLNYSTREDAPLGPQLQSMPSEQIRNQLTAMSSALAKALEVIKPPNIVQEKEEQHQLAVTAYLKNSRKEHQRILARRQTIEERKERLESLNIQREKEELEQREAELQKVRKAEEERLRQEAKEREKERILQEHEQIKKKTVRERLEQIKKTELGAKAFKDIDIEDLEELDPDFIMAKQVEQLEKEKKELQERLKNQEKKIDYFERAKRLEEIPLIKTAYEEQRIRDMDLWEQQEEERISTMQLEREKALEHKNRMSRMVEDKDLFVSRLKAARQSIYQEKLKQFEERLAEERHNRLEERKRQRKEERRISYYREKEEEEQRLQEEKMLKELEEKERIEREKREEEQREYQERVRKLEEVERKKRQREQEIEERERRREEERRGLDDPLSRRESRWGDRDADNTWRRTAEPESEWRRAPPEREWRRGEGRDDERPFRRGDDLLRRGGVEEKEPSSREANEDRAPKQDVDQDREPMRGVDEDGEPRRDEDREPRRDEDGEPKRDEDGGPRRGVDEDGGPRRGVDQDRGSWRTADDDRGPRRGLDDDRGPRRGLDDDRGPRRGLDDDRGPRRGLDDDRGSWRTADEDRGPRRGLDEDRGPRRGLDEDRGPRRGLDEDRGPRRGLDEDRGSWRTADDDRGPRRGLDDDRGPRRGLDDDRGPRRGLDDDRGPRRGLDDDRGSWRTADDDRGPRRGLDDDRISRRDEDRGPWRSADEDRLSRRDDDRGPWRGGDDDRGPRRSDDSRPGPWRPFGKPGGWREREKAREDSWGPPRDSRPSEDRELDRDKDIDENEKDREFDKDRDLDRDDRFRRPRDEAGWRRGPAEEVSSWRDSSRRDEWDRGGRDMRDDRGVRDLRDRRGDDRDRRGPPIRTDREETSSWRRGDDRKEERGEERETIRRAAPAPAPTPVPAAAPAAAPPPISKDRERDAESEKGSWRTEKERESLRRTKHETDEDGWTTVRR